MNDQIILQRIIRDPKRVFIIGGYLIPKIRDDGKKMDIEDEYNNAISSLYKTPNYPNFIHRLVEKLTNITDTDLFEFIPEFPLIIEDSNFLSNLLGGNIDKQHFRADIFFQRLGIIVELDSSWHKDPKIDQVRDRYIEYTWGIKTVRVELGLVDSEENKEILDSRFEEIWKVLEAAYNKVLKNRMLIRSGKPGTLDFPYIVNYNTYLIRQFRREERDTIKICEKYLESQKGFYTSKTVVLNLKNLDSKDLKLFNNPVLYFEERLQRLLSYIYGKDLRVIRP